MRNSSTVFIHLNIQKVLDDNIPLFLSSNGVVLCPGVTSTGILPPEYFLSVQHETITNCYGFLIFDPSFEHTIVVTTPKGGNSYPKGKREKGETPFQTALRELNEETGLTKNDIQILTDTSTGHPEIYEVKNGKSSIGYYVAICKAGTRQELSVMDPEELDTVQWLTTDQALSRMVERRQEPLLVAMSMVQTIAQQ